MSKYMTIYIIAAVVLIVLIVGGVYMSKEQGYLTTLIPMNSGQELC